MTDSTSSLEPSGDDESPYESPPFPIDDRVSAFLEAYTIPLQHSCVRFDDEDEVFAFWSQNDPTQHNPSSDDPGLVPDSPDDRSQIHHKLKEALIENMVYYFLDGLIQFWSIVNTGSRCLLATDNQPFAINLESGCEEYRLRSHEYKYNIDPINNNMEVEEDPFIINGAPANVFRSHLAEIIVDLSVHRGSPLVNSALGCGLMCCFLISICDASQTRCVGVLECCAKGLDSLLETSYLLLCTLEEVGLRMFRVQKDLLYKTIGDLKGRDDEIERALEMACELYSLRLAHVSINYEDENHMQRTVALSLLKQPFINFKQGSLYYCHYCEMLPVKIVEGLVQKVLENYEPHSSRNIYVMSDIEQPITINMKKYSCLVICFKSIPTDDHVDFTYDHVEYVFEFLWPSEKGYETTIKRLILTLTWCLPNFKFACGAEFGYGFRVIDVGNFSESGIQTILEFFKGNKQSPIPKVLEEGRKRKDGKGKTHEISLTQHEIEQQYGRTMEEAARNLNVSKSTLKPKWMGLNIGSWPGPNGGGGGGRERYCDHVTIKAEYQNDLTKLNLPLSLITFEAVEKRIGEKLKLDACSFKLKYCDEDGDWILLVYDEGMRDCIKSSRSLNISTIRLRVT